MVLSPNKGLSDRPNTFELLFLNLELKQAPVKFMANFSCSLSKFIKKITCPRTRGHCSGLFKSGTLCESSGFAVLKSGQHMMPIFLNHFKSLVLTRAELMLIFFENGLVFGPETVFEMGELKILVSFVLARARNSDSFFFIDDTSVGIS